MRGLDRGLDPRIHVLPAREDVDGRAEPGHDEFNLIGKRLGQRVLGPPLDGSKGN
jgi:hypothetical protein